MKLIDEYIRYISDIRRYSDRTAAIYGSVLKDYLAFASREVPVGSDDEFVKAFNVSELREYEAGLMEGKEGKNPRTVSLHMSALGGFCRFLMQKGLMKSNPVSLVPRPKAEKRVTPFFRKESMDEFFEVTSYLLDSSALSAFLSEWHTKSGRDYYDALLRRLIVSTLYSLGIRRSELIGLRLSDVDFGRNVVKVRGKGDKIREIPLVISLSEEILLYLKAVEAICGEKRSLKEPLFVTYKGAALYPVYVDRAVKSALGGVRSIKGRKSPHMLRHTLATELMNEDTSINSIKELLGHASLATTQIYTHSSIARLKHIYEHAHPRAKNGGKHGD